MKQNNELNTIEKEYSLDQLRYNSLHIWPFLRQRIYFEIINKKFSFNSKLRTRNKRQLIENLFFGFGNLFRLKKFDFLFFNNADKRTHNKNGKAYDVFFDAWADKMGQEKCLFIEWAIDKHIDKQKLYSHHVISDLIFKSLVSIYSLFIRINENDFKEVANLKSDYGLVFDTKKELKSKLGELYFYKALFKWVKPKGIFLISSFTKTSIVIAAHLCKIKVYEAQHGYIGDNHQFYNSNYNFGNFYYPDYLISFGHHERLNIPIDFIFESSQILPVGSLQLEDIKDNFKSEDLESYKNIYHKIFCVTLQTVKEEELLKWVNTQARLNKDFLFIIKPKNNVFDYSEFTRLENCILLPQYNIYEILKYSDYNITIYSTTAVEAPFYGAKTIFYNIEGLSEKYYDVKTLDAVLLNVEDSILPEHLENERQPKAPYFISRYKDNVIKTKLNF